MRLPQTSPQPPRNRFSKQGALALDYGLEFTRNFHNQAKMPQKGRENDAGMRPPGQMEQIEVIGGHEKDSAPLPLFRSFLVVAVNWQRHATRIIPPSFAIFPCYGSSAFRQTTKRRSTAERTESVDERQKTFVDKIIFGS